VVWDFRHLQAALKSQFTSTIRQPLKDIGFKRWDFNKKERIANWEFGLNL